MSKWSKKIGEEGARGCAVGAGRRAKIIGWLGVGRELGRGWDSARDGATMEHTEFIGPAGRILNRAWRSARSALAKLELAGVLHAWVLGRLTGGAGLSGGDTGSHSGRSLDLSLSN